MRPFTQQATQTVDDAPRWTDAAPVLPEAPVDAVVATHTAIESAGSTLASSLRYARAPDDSQPARILFHVPRSVAPEDSSALIAAVDAANWPTEAPRPIGFTISETHIRYYHPEDRSTAESVAGLVAAAARDFTTYRPSPPLGTVEVWMSGRSGGSARRSVGSGGEGGTGARRNERTASPITAFLRWMEAAVIEPGPAQRDGDGPRGR